MTKTTAHTALLLTTFLALTAGFSADYGKAPPSLDYQPSLTLDNAKDYAGTAPQSLDYPATLVAAPGGSPQIQQAQSGLEAAPAPSHRHSKKTKHSSSRI